MGLEKKLPYAFGLRPKVAPELSLVCLDKFSGDRNTVLSFGVMGNDCMLLNAISCEYLVSQYNLLRSNFGEACTSL
ncbi:hypothetical protein ZIOFF_054402 [Zingiber officinale]|uniref:Uncharacterized protein n=1 Tax=Zingiber officinale TaxID=94328 RepID=A0A8J5KDM6_ZINOF|nr:hypothetical protein ZIOFF_054402 [Zingiber officinale]